MIVAHTIVMSGPGGARSFNVWLYDTDKPRGLDELTSRYACVDLLGSYRTHTQAEKAIRDGGYELLVNVDIDAHRAIGDDGRLE